MMKYYVAYPISLDCDLHCSYCFHSYRHAANYNGVEGEEGDSAKQPRMTFTDWDRFRDTHLAGAEDIVVHFHGGETFLPTNARTIQAFMRHTKAERADLLTNGLQDPEMYRTIEGYAGRVHRVGMTFHRRVIQDVPELVERFEHNAAILKGIVGDRLYIKELLFAGTREMLLAAKKSWEVLGYRYKIQDFKGTHRGRDFSEWRRYTAEDMLAIDSEYKRGGSECACMRGYVNILIRGGWHDGDVLACFEDPTVVGSVQRNEYLPGYRIFKDFQVGRIDVQGVPKNYTGSWDRDLYKPPCGTD
jgi:hypothetical protein